MRFGSWDVGQIGIGITYFERVQHEAQTWTSREYYGLLKVALAARRHVVHLRPYVGDVGGSHCG